MRSMKKFGVLAVVVFALSAIGAANASAAQFTASATGSITGKALETQEFTINAGTIRCPIAETSGPITSSPSSEQQAHVTYKNCTAFASFVPVHNITADYVFTANGTVHIAQTITITVTAPFKTCHVTVGPQPVGTVDYANNGAGNGILITPTVTGISYSSTGDLCGKSGTNGTYKGVNEVTRVGGGFFRYDK